MLYFGLFPVCLTWDAHIWIASCKGRQLFIKGLFLSVVLNVAYTDFSEHYPLQNISHPKAFSDTGAYFLET